MIFVCLGTKRFAFNRLLTEIDSLIENKKVTDNVLAQIGQSDYTPVNYEYKEFMTPVEYDNAVHNADLIITHGGTGAIIKALKAHKQVISVPRREKYGEHSDDHQLQIVEFFSNNGYVKRIDEMEELEESIKTLFSNPIEKKFEGKGNIIDIIDDFIKKG